MNKIEAYISNIPRGWQNEAINKQEEAVFDSLIAYVAYKKNKAPITVTELLKAQFEVDDVDTLPASQYILAIEYLIDLAENKMLLH